MFAGKKKWWIVSGIVALAGAGYGADVMLQPEPPTYQVIQWTKPTTDEGWAEESKIGNFDIKSTKVLQEMVSTHQAKLQRILAGKKEVLECPECIKFKIRENNPELSTAEIEAQYQEELAQAQWEIDNLNQNIERMAKEVELRDKGFVVVDDGTLTEKQKKTKIIRKIND